jgi:hypothetical protein
LPGPGGQPGGGIDFQLRFSRRRAAVALFALLIVFANLVTDIAVAWLDPKTSLEHSRLARLHTNLLARRKTFSSKP